MTNIIGIDPGLTGAVAYLTPKDLQIWDMPVLEVVVGKKKRKEVDEVTLSDILEDLTGFVYLEKVWAVTRPGKPQGGAAMFSFGTGYGMIRGIIAAYQMQRELVPPNTWKSALKVRAGKDGSIMKAMELFPSYSGLWQTPRGRLLDGRAEAALIAYYGRMQQNG